MQSLNFAVGPQLEDLAWLEATYSAEFLTRLKLVMGSQYSNNFSWGIVAENDPSEALTSDAYPFVVRMNNTEPMKYDVALGLAVTRNGDWLSVASAFTQQTLASETLGAINVVFLEYSTEPTVYRTTRARQSVPVRNTNPTQSTYLKCELLSTYLAYTAAELLNIVPLAVITIAPDATGATTVAVVDLSDSSYTWNRPWFSAVDIKHRQSLGTGTATEHNPHGLSVNDLSAGNLTYLQTILRHGMVVAKDECWPKVPGVVCSESIDPASVMVDATAEVTGFTNAVYFTLQRFPIAITKLSASGIACDILPGTNIVWSRKAGTPGGIPTAGLAFTIWYFAVDAAEPPVPGGTSLTVRSPNTHQLIVAGGLGHDDLTNPTLLFDDAAQVPAEFLCYIDANGEVKKNPQPLLCFTRLSTIGATQYPIPITMAANGRIFIALRLASGAPLMSIKLTVQGKDALGVAQTEQLTFDSSWTDNPPPALTPSNSVFAWGTKIFSSLETIVIDERLNDGANSAIVVYNNMASYQGNTLTGLVDACPVALVFWNGYSLKRVIDIRSIDTHARHMIGDASLQLAIGGFAIGIPYTYVMHEDFDHPKYLNVFDSVVSAGQDRFMQGGSMPAMYWGGEYNELRSRWIPVHATGLRSVAAIAPLAEGWFDAHRMATTNPCYIKILQDDNTEVTAVCNNYGVMGYTVPVGRYIVAVKYFANYQWPVRGFLFLFATP